MPAARDITVHLCLLVTLVAPHGSSAQPLQVPGVEVTDRPMEPEDPEGQPSSFATSHALTEAGTEARTLAEELASGPGVQTRSLGGLGSFTAVLIRGSSPDQVAVFLDGIPLNPPGGGAVDLSTLPFFLMGRIDVYRGFLPVEFGSFGLGGAVNIVPRWPKGPSSWEALTALGSWWTRRAGVSWTGHEGQWAWSLAAVYEGTQGDFRYYDDNQTPYETSDDRIRKRSNNQYDSTQLVCLARRSGPWQTSVLENLSWRRSELAGTASQPPVTGPYYAYLRQALGLRARRRWPRVHSGLTFRLYGVYTYEQFSNPEGRLLSISQTDSLQHTLRAGLLGRYEWTWREIQVLSLVADLGAGFYTALDALDGETQSGRERLSAGLAVRDEWYLFDGRLYLAPVLRADVVTDSWDQERILRWLVSPRLGVAYSPLEGLTVKSNVGRYFRPPTFLELFGLHGVVRGRPDLQAESGWALDLGVQYAATPKGRSLDRVLLEVVGFGNRVSNLIFFLPSARALVAENWGEAWLAGAEVSAAVWLLRSFRATAAYTFLYSTYLGPATYLVGNALPGRSRHVFHTRLDWAWTWRRLGLGLFGELEYRSAFYRDLGNRKRAPARAILSLGCKLRPWLRGLTVTLEVRNVTNRLVDWVPAPAYTGLERIPQAVADYAGYPLPGRAFYLTINYRGRRSP